MDLSNEETGPVEERAMNERQQKGQENTHEGVDMAVGWRIDPGALSAFLSSRPLFSLFSSSFKLLAQRTPSIASACTEPCFVIPPLAGAPPASPPVWQGPRKNQVAIEGRKRGWTEGKAALERRSGGL
mmetsp:Transcript_22217/g.44070  ORF Transcript_22217/g.44070 Transcript_22217/m.44070 type:complete len:128 (+) Transcript_22217:1038-1421(+)